MSDPSTRNGVWVGSEACLEREKWIYNLLRGGNQWRGNGVVKVIRGPPGLRIKKVNISGEMRGKIIKKPIKNYFWPGKYALNWKIGQVAAHVGHCARMVAYSGFRDISVTNRGHKTDGMGGARKRGWRDIPRIRKCHSNRTRFLQREENGHDFRVGATKKSLDKASFHHLLSW